MHKDVYFVALHDYAAQQADEIELIQGNVKFFYSKLGILLKMSLVRSTNKGLRVDIQSGQNSVWGILEGF